MNAVATRFLSFGTVELLDKFIGVFRRIDPAICERIFTLRAEPRDLFRFGLAAIHSMGPRALLRALPREERFQILADLARAIVCFGKESLLRLLGRKPERGFGVFAEE